MATQKRRSFSSKHKENKLEIKDETTNTPQVILIENMRTLQDCSLLTINQQLIKLRDDGVIFLRAPADNDNALRTHAIKLRKVLNKLCAKYQFVEKVPHPNHDLTVIYLVCNSLTNQ